MAAPMMADEDKETALQKVGNFLTDNVWQYAHIAGAAFLFYEDRLLFACSIAGFVGLLGGCLALEAARIAPTYGERLWRAVVPVCGALAVVFSLGSRLMHITAHASVCAATLVACFGVTALTVRGDKDARLRL
mmetsp:Transcript_26829/g.80881  ORF Transcript_26829/g.80881 Transcript_26829/m.80881 type:complete len:133 (-) Transcript_26829:412-810(-)